MPRAIVSEVLLHHLRPPFAESWRENFMIRYSPGELRYETPPQTVKQEQQVTEVRCDGKRVHKGVNSSPQFGFT